MEAPVAPEYELGADDTVALMLPNVPAMYEVHFAVPMAGAVINALNIRLDAGSIAFQLEHSGARFMRADPEFAATVKAALEQLEDPPLVIDVADPFVEDGELIGDIEYEDLLAGGDPDCSWSSP